MYSTEKWNPSGLTLNRTCGGQVEAANESHDLFRAMVPLLQGDGTTVRNASARYPDAAGVDVTRKRALHKPGRPFAIILKCTDLLNVE